jgi:FAD/FMN-containing dehydrogenase
MNERNPSAALAALAERLGSKGFIVGDLTQRHAADASVVPPVAPVAVLRPGDTQAVSDILKICARHRQPVTIQGGLTGLCGGATPSPGSVALSLERMAGVEEVDPQAMTLTALAGTPLQVAQEAAAAAGFLFPIDFTARGTATVGGIVATNAGGNRVLRYGMARASTLGLEAVLPDGAIVGSLNKMVKNNAGYDLKQLFIGSEGAFGVVTRAVFALQPAPRWTGLALVAMTHFAKAAALLASARRGLGPMLSAYEAMWPDYWRMVTRNVAGRRDPFSTPHGLYVLIEAHGCDADKDAAVFEAWLTRAVEDELVEDAMLAASLSDMADFWAIREASAEIEPVLGEHESFDVGLPPADIGRFVDACRKRLEADFPGKPSAFFGHAADGNIHVMAAVPFSGPDGHHAVESAVYDVTRAFGGSISAEHGIGSLKRAWLGHSRSEAEIALMRRLKEALDPQDLINPGKVLP